MKTLVAANRNGGVGKTATPVHLAYNFVARGAKIIAIDPDAPPTAYFALGAFAAPFTASQLFAQIPTALLSMPAAPPGMVPPRVGLRSRIAGALASCVSAWRIRKTAARKAAQEVRDLADHVRRQMEIPA